MDNKLKINIKVNGYTTSLKIDPTTEHIYRSASKLLNQRIELYNNKFDVPYTDILNMVAYEFALEYSKLLETKQMKPQEEIDELSKLLESIDLEDI